jgi:hypothetical protein
MDYEKYLALAGLGGWFCLGITRAPFVNHQSVYIIRMVFGSEKSTEFSFGNFEIYQGQYRDNVIIPQGQGYSQFLKHIVVTHTVVGSGVGRCIGIWLFQVRWRDFTKYILCTKEKHKVVAIVERIV